MNKGIEILLARMESNPDEFVAGDKVGVRNWMSLVEQFEDDMHPEEKAALMGKYHALRMDKFTERVMKELFKEQEEKNEEFGQYIRAAQQRAQLAQQNALAQQLYYNNTQNQAGSFTGVTSAAIGTGASNIVWGSGATAHAAEAMRIDANGNVGINTNLTTPSIKIGKQTLTEKTLKKLKALVK